MSKYNYNESQYKKSRKEEDAKALAEDKIAKEKAKEAASIFLNESYTLEERLEAAKKMSRLTGDDIGKGLALFRNTDLSEDLRACAFIGISGLVFSEEEVMQDAIKEIKKGEGSGKIALASIGAVQAAQISAPQLYGAYQAEYKDALRTAIDHSNTDLRGSALEILAINKDEYAQRRLVASLEDDAEAIVAPEIAVQLLSYDLHANHFKVLREVAKKSPNTIAKRESIRNLGFDEASKTLLEDTLNDLNEDPETRHAAALSLLCLNPERSVEASKKIIIEEEGEHIDELKTALLNTLVFLEKEGKEGTDSGSTIFKSSSVAEDKGDQIPLKAIKSDPNFTEKLRSLKGTSKFSALNEMIDLYLKNHNE